LETAFCPTSSSARLILRQSGSRSMSAKKHNALSYLSVTTPDMVREQSIFCISGIGKASALALSQRNARTLDELCAAFIETICVRNGNRKRYDAGLWTSENIGLRSSPYMQQQRSDLTLCSFIIGLISHAVARSLFTALGDEDRLESLHRVQMAMQPVAFNGDWFTEDGELVGAAPAPHAVPVHVPAVVQAAPAPVRAPVPAPVVQAAPAPVRAPVQAAVVQAAPAPVRGRGRDRDRDRSRDRSPREHAPVRADHAHDVDINALIKELQAARAEIAQLRSRPVEDTTDYETTEDDTKEEPIEISDSDSSMTAEMDNLRHQLYKMPACLSDDESVQSVKTVKSSGRKNTRSGPTTHVLVLSRLVCYGT